MDPELIAAKELLEKSIDSLGGWLEFWTAIVVIGLLIEYVPEFIERLKEIDKRSLHTKIGGILITVGVAGELFVGVIASSKETNLRNVTDSITASLNQEAAGARKEAAEAIERSAKAESNLAQANALAANALKAAQGFQLEIAQANERAANAEKETARLNKLAEEERLARVRIEEQIADRILTDEGVIKIAAELRPFPGQQFKIITYWESREPLALTNRIYSAIIRAGWKFIRPANRSNLIWGISGISVYVHPAATELTKKAAEALVSALDKQGLPSALREHNPKDDPTNMIQINVGTKP
ncbi:MAG: hypothetical protein A3H28_05815 [Acidobacteria bacterium RIFCSPLOWO2_02_FULL_61_28]|nr:MAG: hypothetical protein A3H28_05815 [Acidobacteria bacterium RIFCSPLOWO2_02_FULL_61_28]